MCGSKYGTWRTAQSKLYDLRGSQAHSRRITGSAHTLIELKIQRSEPAANRSTSLKEQGLHVRPRLPLKAPIEDKNEFFGADVLRPPRSVAGVDFRPRQGFGAREGKAHWRRSKS